MAHRNTDQLGDHGIDIAKRRRFNQQTQRQHHCQHAETRDQREERFCHRRRYAFRHADDQVAVVNEAVDFGGEQGNQNCHEQPLTANLPHRHDAFDQLRHVATRRGKHDVLWNGHHEGHQGDSPGGQRVEGAVLLRQTVGDTEAGDQRHDVVGRFHRIEHLFLPRWAEELGHQRTVARHRQIGEDQEERAYQHKRHVQDDPVTHRKHMFLSGDFERGR